MILCVIVAAEGHGLGGVVVGVGRIGLVELLPEGDLRQQFAELPVLGIVHGEQVVLQVVPAGKAGDFFGADGHLGAGRKAGRKVDLAGRQDEHQKQHHQHHKAEPVQDALVLHKESRLLWRCPGQTPLGEEEAHGAGGKHEIIAGDAVEHEHAHHLTGRQKAAVQQQKSGLDGAHACHVGQGGAGMSRFGCPAGEISGPDQGAGVQQSGGFGVRFAFYAGWRIRFAVAIYVDRQCLPLFPGGFVLRLCTECRLFGSCHPLPETGCRRIDPIF